MNVDLTLVFFGLLVFLAHLFTSIYNRKKIPDVLLLIFIGLIIGPLFHLVDVKNFGVGGPIFVGVTLVVILFEGGTSLSLSVMRLAWKSTMNLTLSCFVASLLLISLVGYFFDMSFLSALTLGAILGGTSSAVVIPLVKNLQMGEECRTVLVLESAATDVLCIVLALAFLQAVHLGTVQVGIVLGNIFSSFVLAGIFGFAGALIWSRLLTRVRKLQNSIFTTPAFVFIIYGLADLLGYSGAIAALVFGITMANIDTFTNAFLLKIMGGRGHKLNRTEMVFFGEIVFLLKTVFFVYIGVSIEFNDLRAVIAGLIITFLLFFARILITRFFAPKKASVFDKTITSLMIPKGLAAAVLAGMPVAMGIPDGLFIKNVTYSVILFSISWVSIMILLVDKSKKIRRVYEWIYGKKTELSVVGDGTIFKTDKEKMEESQEDGLNTYFERSASSVLSAQAEKREKREKSDFPLLTAETISSSFNAIKDVNDIIDSQTNLDTDETEKESTVDFSEEKNKTKNAFEEVNRENTPLQKD